jgi:hypothetical protein
MSASDERMTILQMIEDGKITAAEGLRLLNVLGGTKATAARGETGEGTATPVGADSPADGGVPRREPASPTGAPPASDSHIPDMGGWRNWWMFPLGVGIAIVVFGGLLMYWAYTAGGFSVWFACGTLPFILGVAVMALAAASRTSRWIHVRVNTGQAEWPQRIAISFPLPIRVAAWFLKTFGQFIPKLKDTGVDELILALEETTSPDNPLFVDVHEGEGGERVQVYIG